ncbi:hypothetical protein HOLleu_40176 [Holothuria leucospilota]|uniref:Uncharacterized protein n=1 Tax=Holothuria leucospilota TaxID=206669 RepID=A0A9Q1BBG9_HOLLE|nr:hypothetical protein HOLleu_40176 [Holothuria leucospilota]
MVRSYHRDFHGLSHLIPKMEIPKSDLTLCVVCLIAGVALIFIGGITIEEKILITLQMDPGASVLNHALPCIQGMVELAVGFIGFFSTMTLKKYSLVRRLHRSLLVANQILSYIAFWVICIDLKERLYQNEICRSLTRCAAPLNDPWQEEVYIFVPCRPKGPIPVFCDGGEVKRIVCDVILLLVYVISIKTVSIVTLGNPFELFLGREEKKKFSVEERLCESQEPVAPS